MMIIIVHLMMLIPTYIFFYIYYFNGSCNYYFKQSLRQVLNKHFGNVFGHGALSLVHMNIRSLKTNYLSFEAFVDNVELDFSVIGLSETWLCDWNCNLYDIPGYNFIEAYRSSRKGGGVGMYLRDVIPFQYRNDLVMPDCNCECIFIEVDKDIFAKSKNAIIGVIYRPSNIDLNLFNDNMERCLFSSGMRINVI